MAGTLFLTATPIGNLKDITLRAIEVLKEADLIACEDTRVTLKLLNHYNIKKKLISFHKFNQGKKTNYLISLLKEGKNIALVSDRGTPGIQDPGEYLASKCIEENIRISPVPGACAFISALICSGISTARFKFYGYLPHKEKERVVVLKEIKFNKDTIILYEAPHKIRKTLKDLYSALGGRKICLAKELTKIFEEITHGNLNDIIEKMNENNKTIKGEYTIIIEGDKVKPQTDLKSVKDAIITQYKKLNSKELIKKISQEFGISKNIVYKTYLEIVKYDKKNN